MRARLESEGESEWEREIESVSKSKMCTKMLTIAIPTSTAVIIYVNVIVFGWVNYHFSGLSSIFKIQRPPEGYSSLPLVLLVAHMNPLKNHQTYTLLTLKLEPHGHENFVQNTNFKNMLNLTKSLRVYVHLYFSLKRLKLQQLPVFQPTAAACSPPSRIGH